MGNDPSSFNSEKHKSSFNWEKQYIVLNKHSNNVLKLQKRDPHSSHATTNSNSAYQRQVYYGRELIVPNKQQKLQVQRLIQQKSLNPSPYLTEIQKSAICKTDNYCSSQEKYYILFKTPQATLKQDAINRRLTGTSYSESQIMMIIENILKALKYLRGIRQPHQNISTSSVFIKFNKSHNQAFAVLGDPWISSSSQMIHKSSAAHSYPSFQKLMYRSDTIQKYDSFLSDMFSLGCLILELVYQQGINAIYNKGCTAINQLQLQRKISHVASEQVRNAIRILCSKNVTQRETIFNMFKESSKKTFIKTSVFTKGNQKQSNLIVNNTPICSTVLKITNSNTPMMQSQSLSRQQNTNRDNGLARNIQNLSIEKKAQNLGKYTTSNIYFGNYSTSHLNNKYEGNNYGTYHRGVYPPVQNINKVSFNPHIKQNSNNFPSQIPTYAFSNSSFNIISPEIRTPINSKSLQKRQSNSPLPILDKYSDYNTKSEISVNKDQRSYSMSKISSSQNLVSKPFNSKFSTQTNFTNYDGPLATNRNFGFAEYRTNMPIQNTKKNELLLMNSGKKPFTFNSMTSQKQVRVQEEISFDIKIQKQEMPSDIKVQKQFAFSSTEGSKVNKQKQPIFTQKESSIVQKQKQLNFVQKDGSKAQNQKQFENYFQDSSKDKSRLDKFKQIQQRINNTIKNLKLTPNQGLLSQVIQNPKKQQIQPTSDRSHKQQQRQRQQQQQSIIKIQDQLQGQQEAQQKDKTPKRVQTPIFGQIIEQAANQSASEEQGHQQQSGSLIFVIQDYDVGSRYEGFKYNGMRNGKGKFFYKEGSYYDGEWLNNKMHGKGMLYYANGKVAYDGEWYNDEFNGIGKVYNDEVKPFQGHFDYTDFYKLEDYWQFYEGQLKTDSRDGKGKVKLSNGEFFIGNFSKDKVSGEGTYYTKEGNCIKGIWKNNRLIAKE